MCFACGPLLTLQLLGALGTLGTLRGRVVRAHQSHLGSQKHSTYSGSQASMMKYQ